MLRLYYASIKLTRWQIYDMGRIIEFSTGVTDAETSYGLIEQCLDDQKGELLLLSLERGDCERKTLGK
jgi:hypothetical protein